nr:MAG TPA: hypothetical protein [Caudoviricetes sp.]
MARIGNVATAPYPEGTAVSPHCGRLNLIALFSYLQRTFRIIF